MVPDDEIGLDEGRLRRMVYVRRRLSGAGTIANGGTAPFEVPSGTDAGSDSNVAADSELGRPVDSSLGPVASSRSSDEHAAGPDAVVPVPAGHFRSRSDRTMPYAEQGPWPLTEQPSDPAPQPLAKDSGSRPEGNRRQEWCAIVFAGAKRQGEFRVVAVDDGGQRQVIARSSPFRASRSGGVSRRGGAKEAHNLLVKRLLALGWRRVASRGRWHDTAFTRTAPDADRPVERLLIICGHDRLAARFKAARFDDLYNATIVAESTPFRALHVRGSMKLGLGARKVHRALLEHLQADGWQTTGKTGGEWYADLLARSTELPFSVITDRELAGPRWIDSP